jgi:hypothetical protein
MSGKVIQLLLPLEPPISPPVTKEEIFKFFDSILSQNRKLFAQNSDIIKQLANFSVKAEILSVKAEILSVKAEELDSSFFNMKKRLDNISENYLEKDC